MIKAEKYVVVLALADKKTVRIFKTASKPSPVFVLPRPFRTPKVFCIEPLNKGDYERRIRAIKHLPVSREKALMIFDATDGANGILFYNEVPVSDVRKLPVVL